MPCVRCWWRTRRRPRPPARSATSWSGALSSELKVDVAETTHRGHARELAAQATADGVDVVVTLGGDGTVNEAANGLLADRTGPARADAGHRARRVDERLLPGAGPLPGPGGGDRRDPRLDPGRPHPPGPARGRHRRGPARPDATDGWTAPRWFVFAAGMGFDADVISRVEAQRARGRRSTGALYVRAGGERLPARPGPAPAADDPRAAGRAAGRRAVPGLVSNVSPWTYLGARPIQPSPEASLDTGLDVFAMGRVGRRPDAAPPAADDGRPTRTPAAAACTAGTTSAS